MRFISSIQFGTVLRTWGDACYIDGNHLFISWDLQVLCTL